MSRSHIPLILGALEVGLEGAEHPSLTYEIPTLIETLPPPTAVRAIVTIDCEPYEVTIRKAASEASVYPDDPHAP